MSAEQAVLTRRRRCNDERLTEAHRARNRGRDRRAIALYRRILLEDPHNVDVGMRLAPMLARRGHGFEAWRIYQSLARDCVRARRWNDCLNIYREACNFIPWEFEAWRVCAELQMKLGNVDAAFETLVDGHNHFRNPHCRDQAIALLSRARVIEPWEPDIAIDLARLYAQTDQVDTGLELLSCLALRVRGSALRRVRALQWRITLSPRFAFLWLRALGESSDETQLDPLESSAFGPLP
jgi:tetratricopeptide (TPR) repeat protein